MTVVVGATDGTDVFVGTDSGCSDEYGGGVLVSATKGLIEVDVFMKQTFPNPAEKVGTLLIGVAGIHHAMMEIKHNWTPPYLFDDETPDDQMYQITGSLRELLMAESIWPMLKEEGKETGEIDMIIGWRGAIYEVDGSFAFIRVARGWHAVGSGALPALGALEYMSRYEQASPEEMVRRSLSVSEALSAEIRSPFDVRRTDHAA